MKNFPGYCKRCKQESIINIDNRAESRIVNS
nr:MAG TPA_asm: Bromelain inhibitor VI [Caudoviricetes sp.]